MTGSLAPGAVIDEVPVFPLPQVVLFPGVRMPLHVFEPRYRAMTRDALAGPRRIVVAHIPEDHEIRPCGQPSIATVAGLGEIVEHEALADGRFHLVLEGRARVRLEELPFRRPYRRARATVVGDEWGPIDPALARALAGAADRVAAVIRRWHPGFRFCAPEGPCLARLTDACAHYLVRDGDLRQALLETASVPERVERCLGALMEQEAMFRSAPDPLGPN